MQRILLLDPDCERRERIAFFLRHTGYQVDVGVGSRNVAVGQRRSEADLVIVAQHCPAMCDCGVARQMFRLFDMPKIVLGDDYEEVAGVPFLEMGADAYLPMPLDAREMLARVRMLLSRSTKEERNLTSAGGFACTPEGSASRVY
ncbi:MAG: response regulator transcription factor [Dehalococcoidia bacterium]|nr:response regulator transcription factor [Dehalococcoidia bacterium]